MADMSKAERLAAARRKLQDYQRNKDRPLTSNVDSLSSSSELLLEQNTAVSQDPHHQNKHLHTVENSHQQSRPPSAHSSSPQLTYFASSPSSIHNSQEGTDSHVLVNGLQPTHAPMDGNAGIAHQFHETHVFQHHDNPAFSNSSKLFSASSFFDSVSELETNSPNSINEDSLLHQVGVPSVEANVEVPLNTASHLFSPSSNINQSHTVDPNKYLLSDSFQSVSTSDTSFINYGPPQVEEVSSALEQSCQSSSFVHPEASISIQNSVNGLPNTSFMSEANDLKSAHASEELQPLVNLTEDAQLHGHSSTESIRQLSDQMNQLLDAPLGSTDFSTSNPQQSTLELKNQEIVAQLSFERRTNQQLQFSLKECQSQVSCLEAKVLELQSQQEVVLARHLGPLQEQLRAHAQTVGILVGEKTELEAALTHHTAAAKQHASEVEELQNRLRASRHRVSELEKELSSLSVSASSADKQRNDHAHEVDQLRLQNSMLSKQLEDAVEEVSELRQKLTARVSEVTALEQQLQEKQSQLSLAQLRVTQLSCSDNPEASSEIESLHQHKISLERRCTELLDTVQQLTAERDQADQQYQQYVAQLNGQLQTVCSKLESANAENNTLKCREEDLVRNMSELEKQLQQLQVQHFQNQQRMDLKATAVCSEDHSGVFERVSQLEEDRQNLMNSLDMQTQEMSRLKSDLEERDTRIAELEVLSKERPDQALLLAAMESDKVAAAQATSQNTILKQQIQELQDGFIKMSNDKLHLTEDLEHEKHVNKEMGEKISQLAEELHELRVLVSDKDRKLQQYQQLEHSHDHSAENCGDLNHNHSHEHKHQAEDMHAHCQESDGKMRVMNSNEGPNGGTKPEETAALQEQLSQAKDHIHNLSSQNNSLRRLLAQKSTESHESGSSSSATEGATTDDATADIDTNCEDMHNKGSSYITMQYAMDKLQERFTRTMAEIAELTEEKQRLEHLVLQLQGETETIGEYVTLYQIQRSVLQQRAKEKDHQLACLSAEREDLRHKLNALNALVHRLIEEKVPETALEALPALSNYFANGDVVHSSDGETEVLPVPEVREEGSEPLVEPVPSTAGKILALLSEIGSSSLVDGSTSTSEAFHPCPWCSGRLLTV